MKRLAEDRPDAANFGKRAGVHDAEPVDELGHQPHVVADQDDRRAEFFLDAPQGLDDLPLHHDVERARRLVGDDHARPQADRDRDHDPLFHPAAQFVRIFVGDLPPKSDRRKQLADPRVQPRPRQRFAMVAQRVGELVGAPGSPD